ncbi:MAG: hypothetical protein WC852_07780, partial [Candidatus Nanoarchaeia archaeon]
MTKCKYCGKEFEDITNIRRYCSSKCYQSTLKGIGNPMYGIKRKCPWVSKANKKRRGEKHHMFGKHYSKEHNENLSKAIKEYYKTHEHPNKLKLDIKEIKRLYLKGRSCTEIAKKFNCSTKPILSLLKNNGIEIRTPAETQRGRIAYRGGWKKVPKYKLEYLIKNYAHKTNLFLSKKLGLNENQITLLASKNKLQKSNEHKTKIRKDLGKKTYHRGLGIGGMSKKERIRIGKIAYSRGIAKLSNEQLSEIGKKGAKAAFEKLVKEGKLEDLKERMRKMAIWHFDKLKKEGKFLEFQHEANKQVPKKDTSIEREFEKAFILRDFKVIEMTEFS